jgi:hypothetical protein
MAAVVSRQAEESRGGYDNSVVTISAKLLSR